MAGAGTDDSAKLTAALADRYRIERELGAGGMATVYLAEDLKHKRKVALKVLKPELAAVLGADRFVQEITTTAALQHPHILPLFDSGEAGGFLFYVMPFIDGETLRSKLDRETQLGVDESLRIACDVSDALNYAHTHGVIHRDIKPENILLHNGRPMVADFGIALALSAAAGGRITETGLSLGTPHYMSPEQATAEKDISARSDIYSLASVLYEMLAGQPPHLGGSAQQIIMKIITEAPRPVTDLRKSVPPHVAEAIAIALEKLPADRFASAGEFGAALSGRHTLAPRAAARAAASARSPRVAVSVLLLVVAAVASVAGWLGRGTRVRTDPQSPVTFTTSLGRPGADRPFISLADDGLRIIQAVSDSAGNSRLMVRDLVTNTVTAIPGTEQARDGQFSPDGEWIAFVGNGKLRKVAVKGGPPITLVEGMTVDGNAVAWTSAGDIIFSGRNSGLWRVSAGGGSPVQITQLDTARKEFGHWFPRMLPGGRAVIYTSYATNSRIEAHDLESGRTTVLAENAVTGRYSPTGHLLYARDGAVFAVEFDPDRLQTRGTAVPVQDDVVWEETNGLAAYDISANGTFIFLRDSEWSTGRTVVWRDRAGRDVPVIETAGAFTEPRISPDGRWIALTVEKPKLEIWLYDVGRRVLAQLTRAPAAAFNVAWLPDSRRIIYTFESPVYDLHLITIDGSAPDRTLMTGSYDKYASSISPDGRHMLVTEFVDGPRVLLASTGDTVTARPLSETGSEQRLAVFSPDGRWIAFSETGAGRSDIYIRSSSGAGGRRLVSSGGGYQPRWTKGGREIVYVTGTAMMSVAIDPSTGAAGTPTELFRVTDLERRLDGMVHNYDVTADGQRFLVVKAVARPATHPLVVVLNWRPDLGSVRSGQ